MQYQSNDERLGSGAMLMSLNGKYWRMTEKYPEMSAYPENLLLFYASVTGHDGYINGRCRELIGKADTDRLVTEAVKLEVAGGLAGRLSDAGCDRDGVVGRLKEAAVREMRVTASMKSLATSVLGILTDAGIDVIPLKGCDPRISGEARGFFNVMHDIDILVKLKDLEEAARALESKGLRCAGPHSPSHTAFLTDDAVPSLVEIHWDIVNRTNPVHSRLFKVKIEKIWERSIKMCSLSLLSPVDLISYLGAHGVKEYYHKPKWLADLAWSVLSLPGEVHHHDARGIVTEWGVGSALGIAAAALNDLLPCGQFDAAYEIGAVKPGLLGRFCAMRLVDYGNLRKLRPLLLLASAETLSGKLAVAAGFARKAADHGRRG